MWASTTPGIGPNELGLIPLTNLVHQFLDSAVATPLNYVAGAVLLLLGAGMFWQGRHILRGARYLDGLPGQSIRHLRQRRWFAAAQAKGEG